MTTPKSDPRERLLEQTMDHLWEHGIGDLTLRQLAANLGTSHRMLIYHFGSKQGLLVEVAKLVERQQQQMVQDVISTELSLTPSEQLRRMWRYATNEAFSRYLKLFFELYGHALQGRPHTKDFLDGIVDSWLDSLIEVFRREQASEAAARDDARLVVAVLRGLALDVLATGDVAAGDRAIERFLAAYESLGSNRSSRVSRHRTITSHPD